MKICLVCSHGGHFEEMKCIEKAFKDYEYFYVTFKSKSNNDWENSYLLEPKISKITGKHERFRIFYHAFRIFVKENPDVVVTTGGGEIAVPFSYVGKLFGAKIIFLETLTRINTKSAAGKYIYPISDLFLVQWESLLSQYGDKAKYWGRIL